MQGSTRKFPIRDVKIGAVNRSVRILKWAWTGGQAERCGFLNALRLDI